MYECDLRGAEIDESLFKAFFYNKSIGFGYSLTIKFMDIITSTLGKDEGNSFNVVCLRLIKSLAEYPFIEEEKYGKLLTQASYEAVQQLVKNRHMPIKFLANPEYLDRFKQELDSNRIRSLNFDFKQNLIIRKKEYLLYLREQLEERGIEKVKYLSDNMVLRISGAELPQ